MASHLLLSKWVLLSALKQAEWPSFLLCRVLPTWTRVRVMRKLEPVAERAVLFCSQAWQLVEAFRRVCDKFAKPFALRSPLLGKRRW